MKEMKKEYWILNEKDVREWIGLVMKVSNGYELDEKELERLGNGLLIFDAGKMPEDIKAKVKYAKAYFEINREESKK